MNPALAKRRTERWITGLLFLTLASALFALIWERPHYHDAVGAARAGWPPGALWMLWTKSLVPLLPFQALALVLAGTRAAGPMRTVLAVAAGCVASWMAVDLWTQAHYGSNVASYLPFIGSALRDPAHAQWAGDPTGVAFALLRLLAATAAICAVVWILSVALVRGLLANVSWRRLRRVSIAATVFYASAVLAGVALQPWATPRVVRQRLALALPFVPDLVRDAANDEGEALQILALVPWPWRSADHVEVSIRNPGAARSLDGQRLENARGQRVELAGTIEADAIRTLEVARDRFDLSRDTDTVVLADSEGHVESRAAYAGEDVKRGAALWFPPPGGAPAQALRRLDAAAKEAWTSLQPRVVAPRDPAVLVAEARADAPDVVVLIGESLRADVVGPGLMERLDSLASGGLRAQRHYAGSNSSHRGLFALLQGRHPLVYDAVLDAGTAPAAVESFRSLGYRTAFVSSGEIEAWKRMDRFLGAPPFDEVQLHVAQELPLWKQWPDCDRRTLAAIRALLAEPGPHFIVGFLMTTHFPYPYPPAFERFEPVSHEDDLLDWAQLFRAPLERDLLWNRYRNAALSLEAQLSEFVGSLDMSRTVVAITGDHGESFGEDGALVHGSRASDAQTRVPLLVLGAGVPARSLDAPTSHEDVLPTLLHLATGVADPIRGLDGRDLLGATPARDSLLVAPYRLTQPDDLLWIRGNRRVLFRVRTDTPEIEAFAFVDTNGAPLLEADPALLLESESLAAGIAESLAHLTGEVVPPAD